MGRTPPPPPPNFFLKRKKWGFYVGGGWIFKFWGAYGRPCMQYKINSHDTRDGIFCRSDFSWEGGGGYPYPKTIIINLPMRSYSSKNNSGPAVGEILLFKQTNRYKSNYFRLLSLCILCDHVWLVKSYMIHINQGVGTW